MSEEQCGAQHPDEPERTCVRTGSHANHTDGRVSWENSEEYERRSHWPTPGKKPGKKGVDSQTALQVQEMANGVAGLPGSRPPEHFVRTDDPDTSHRAMASYEPKRATAKGRVLFYLRQHRGDWIDAPVLTDPAIGGFGGTRRLRELREDGFPIETRQKPGDPNTWQHRIIEEDVHAGVS